MQNFNLQYNCGDSTTFQPNIWFKLAKKQRYIKYKTRKFGFLQKMKN